MKLRLSATALLPLALLLAYPLLSHLAALAGVPWLHWLALSALLAAPLLPAALAGRAWAWLVLAFLGAGLWWLAHAGGGQFALYLPPVALPLVLAATFASTLVTGRTPFITAIALAVHGTLPDVLLRYTRALTVFWAAFTLMLALVSLALAITGPLWLWSLFSNFVAYGLVAVVFVVEFLLRRRWFPDHPHPGFVEYLGIVARSRPLPGRRP